MKKGCLITILILIGLVGLFFLALTTAFGTDHDEAEIKQNIGGVLICEATENSDIQSWQTDVSYKYKLSNNKLVNIGNGTYYERDWNKDEQLIKFKNWTILKTGGWIGTDKVIIGNANLSKWKEYEFTPDSIGKDSVWKAAKVKSLLNYCCAESFIDQISDGKITLRFKFRTSEKQTEPYGQRKIHYIINELTGEPKMVKVQ